MNGKEFKALVDRLVEMGYEKEISWQRELKPCADSAAFAGEAIWVILNSGMKEQIARKISKRIYEALDKGQPISSAFGHKGKVAAIEYVIVNRHSLFEQYGKAEDKLSFLQTIPFIGAITKYHLAKNLGHDCVKPDRHLARVAEQYGTTPDQLCENIAKETGEKKCVVDIVIWRACNLKLI
jgi:hypothetical protein